MPSKYSIGGFFVMQSGRIDQYKQLSKFNDLKDFNNHFEQWMIDLKEKFTKSETIALKRLVRFSASIEGVCYAKIQTIVAATHEHDGMGISRSTFERMLRKARKVGLIEVHNTFRGVRKGHNVYVFLPYESVTKYSQSSDEVLNGEKIDVSKKTISLSETNNINNIRTQSVPINQSILPSYINSEFARLASYYFQNNNIVELWRIVTIHSQINKLPSETLKKASMEGLKSLVYKIKQGKVKSINGYFNGIIKKLCKKYSIEDMFLSVFDA
jgi:hypothetical protein